jgi:beta-glucosidase
VNREINAATAFVAAWLPGSEGNGVADMLFRKPDGSPAHEFQGRLGYRWPLTADAKGKKLFELGYGLKSSDPGELASLSEDPGIASDQDLAGVYFDKGLPASGWSLQVSDGTPNTTRITTTPVEVAGGRLLISSVDHLTQEGARRFVWRGSGPATIELATQTPIDITREANGDLMLLMTMRVDVMPTAEATLVARCGEGCQGTAPLRLQGNVAPGKWQTVGLSLKCFARTGADMSRLTAPFQLTTSGRMDVSLSRVALGTEADAVLPCG